MDFDRAARVAEYLAELGISPVLLDQLISTLTLPPGSYRNLFDSDARYSGHVELSELLRRVPVSLLIGEGLA